MNIAIPAAATPDTVKKLALRYGVTVESGAGVMACVADEAYLAAGATIGTLAFLSIRICIV